MAVPQRPLRLLSLDGGGIRGLSTLYILRSIMIGLSEKAGLDLASPLRPCDYFDLIAGTSTGGLIAVMLGTLRMDIQTCIDEFLKMAPDIFPVEGLIRGSKFGQLFTVARGRQRFRAEPLELAIKRLVKKYLGDRCTQGEETPFRFEASKLQGDHACKVFLCVMSEKLGKRFQFRSYNSPWDVVDDCPIWQACRATSAAPTFFPPMQIGNPPVAYIDGRLGYNNPIRALIEEKSHVWPDRQIGCIVSIGTGMLVSRDFGKTIKPLVNKFKEMAADTEKVAREFEEEMKHKHGNEQKVYFRFNVQHGLEHVGSEEWKELERIKVATQAYLKSHWSWIDACSTQIFDPKIPATLEDTTLKQHNTTTEEFECLQSLWPEGINYESQKNQNPKRVPNTCLWTLQNPKYTSWRDNGTIKLLWISAGPGCGKSVLARCIVDEDLPRATRNGPSKRTLYYFFKDIRPEQRSATRAISTILHQLFVCQRQLIRYALPSYREIGKALSTNFPKLWSIFIAAVTDPLAGDVTCVLDALDECNEQEQHELIEALKDFCLSRQTSSSTARLKFLITSRPYFEIRRGLDELLEASNYIELAGNDESESIKEEIDLVIRHLVAKLKQDNRLTTEVTEHLEKRLLATENRTYLWLHLLWKIIRKNLSGTKSELDRLIDNLPDDIQGSYEVLLQKCPDPLFARKVLQIVLVACRPLTLSEIDVALKVNEQTSSYADLELEGPSRLQETLPSRCGLVISIIQSKVYFIHQTVKEFLLDTVGDGPPTGRVWQQSLSLEGSQDLMAEICLRSITFSEIQLDRANLCNSLYPEVYREMEPNEYCQMHTFLPYSAIYWAEHCRNVNSDKAIRTIEHVLGSSDQFSIRGRDNVIYGTKLYAASAGGHTKIVEMLLEKGAGADINACVKNYGTALYAASYRGHEAVVQMLLEKVADTDIPGCKDNNALQAASQKGHEKVVQILIEKGADINVQNGMYGNALQAASYNGHEKVVRMLLENGANINLRNGEYWFGDALQFASERGYEKIVQLLLENGADVNVQGGRYGNALQRASERGHEKVVQMLLQKGARIDGNALQAASQGGHEKVVQMLLQKGARIDGNALQAASQGGYEKVVQMLLEKGADMNVQIGPDASNALQIASEGGHEKVVQMLLEKGADINVQNGYFGNALQAASYKGHENVVRMLLENGADVNVENGYYGNALQAASHNGYEEVVRMLLEKGADINVQNGLYGNAVEAAVAKGHVKMLQMLFEKGAEINLGNPLQTASGNGHEKVVQILLENGADINVQGGKSGNALQAASEGGYEKVVQLLLENGADVNVQQCGKYGAGSALQIASERGYEKTVRLLLENGADVNVQGGRYGNPLQIASKKGHVKMVQLLLEKGAIYEDSESDSTAAEEVLEGRQKDTGEQPSP